jgi:hypothetical protein
LFHDSVLVAVEEVTVAEWGEKVYCPEMSSRATTLANGRN